MEALVFDIHRGTTHDGPGMRTTLFLKGCPLSCKWCHNPESIRMRNQIEWTARKCIGCKICVDTCTHGAITLGEQGIYVDPAKCVFCQECAEECPSGALKPIAKPMTVEKALQEVTKDRAFFTQFEGGVTISGGEPMVQVDFVTALLRELKEQNINTAVDTSGYVKQDSFAQVFPYVDTFLYDLKIMENATHKTFTGVENALILQNFRYLCDRIRTEGHCHIWVRTPLIPGATATEENIHAIGKFLQEHAQDVIDRWEICAFNNVCRDKYEKLHVDWNYKDADLMSTDTAKHFQQIARSYLGDKVVLSGLTT